MLVRTSLASAALILFPCIPLNAQIAPEAELADLEADPAFEVSLYASEPLISNPAAIDVDSCGRVWVAEIRNYRGAAKTDPPADAIKVLEDTDGDGKADKVTTFAENIFCPMSICVAGSKVYVATSPDLWVFDDANGDLKADGPPQKLLTGFGGFNHDHGAHSLVLGPDHKWWMSHGDEGFDVTGVDGSHIKFRWGAMLRGELDGTKLETVAVNFRNPYEICVNSFGEAYCSDNDNDGNESVRICWILDGGNYGWFGGPPFAKEDLDARVPAGVPFREAWHFRGFEPGYVPGTLVTGFGSPCGICVLEHDAFGIEFANSLLHCDAGPRVMRRYRYQAKGAGKAMDSTTVLTSKSDGYFRPDDVCVAPDGNLLVSDWYDGGVGGHAYNDPTRGRIFRITPKGASQDSGRGCVPIHSIDSAIVGLKNHNLATQFLAREYLIHAGANAQNSLLALLESGKPYEKARALWLLDRMGFEEPVIAQLHSNEEAMRALAVRILRRHGKEFEKEILSAAKDSSWEVKREVLLALPACESSDANSALLDISAGFDGTDRYLLETLHIAATGRKAALYAALQKRWQKTPPLGVAALMRLLDQEATAKSLLDQANQAQGNEAIEGLIPLVSGVDSLNAAKQLSQWAANASLSEEVRGQAISALSPHLSTKWRDFVGSDEFIKQASRWLQDTPQIKDKALSLLAANRIPAFIPDVTAMAINTNPSENLRVRAIQLLLDWNASSAAEKLRGLLSDNNSAVAAAAKSALVEMQDGPTIRTILSSKEGSSESRFELIEQLMRQPRGPWLLLAMVERSELANDLKERVVQSAGKHPDTSVRLLYEKYLPQGSVPERLGDKLKPEDILSLPGNAKKGEQIFNLSSAAQCRRCHSVHGRGGKIGPELTRIGAKYERATMLETILQPSKAIAPEYVANLVVTTDGQTYLGFLTDGPQGEKVVRTAEGKEIVLNPSAIETFTKQDTSLMPELVLKDVTAQDAADLLAYLTSLK